MPARRAKLDFKVLEAAALLVAVCLAGCGAQQSGTADNADSAVMGKPPAQSRPGDSSAQPTTVKSASTVRPASPVAAASPQSDSAHTPPPPVGSLFGRHNVPKGALLMRTRPSLASSGGGRGISQYDAARLRRAAVPKEWEPVDCGGNIVCWLNTHWLDGELHVTLTLVGPQETLTPFLLHNRAFVLTFTDITSSTLMEFDARPRDFVRAPAAANGGTPTVYFESSIECPLEPYEGSTRWSFHWFS